MHQRRFYLPAAADMPSSLCATYLSHFWHSTPSFVGQNLLILEDRDTPLLQSSEYLMRRTLLGWYESKQE